MASAQIDTILATKNKSNYTFRVKKECIPFLTKYVPVKYLNSGAHGVVYLICEDNDQNKCHYVLKIMHPVLRMKDDDIVREMKIATEMGTLGIGPKVLTTFNCEGEISYGDNEWYQTMLYFIVMEKMDMNLNEYEEKCPDQFATNQSSIKDQINKLLRDVKKSGYIYKSFHYNNIMVNVSGCDIVDMKIIDFGFTKPKALSRQEGRFTIESDEDD